MKILYTWIYAINPLHGGVERVTSVIMHELTKIGHECKNIICENDNQDFYINNEVSEENHLNRNQLGDYLKKESFDVVVCQDACSPNIVSVFRDASEQNTKIVSCLHYEPAIWEKIYSASTLCRVIQASDSLKKKLMWSSRLLVHPVWYKRAVEHVRFIYNETYNNSDAFVLLSKGFIPDMQRYICDKSCDKLVAIPNPLSFEETSSEEVLKEKRKEVLIVARLDEQQKNLSIALKVWKEIQKKGYTDWKLRIVGYGPDETYLKSIVERKHIPNVVFEGWQNPIPYYHGASIFMMTSITEAWGMTLTESMQTGVVPVAMDSYASVHDIIEDGKNGFIVGEGDFEGFVDKVVFLMEHQNERERMARNGLKSVERFTSDNVAKQWDELFKSL